MGGRTRVRIVLVAVIGLFAGDLVGAYVVATRVTPVTVEDAVVAYRESASARRDEVAPPTPPAGASAAVATTITPTTATSTAAAATTSAAAVRAAPGPAAAPRGPAAPTPTGVYRYETTGFEAVDILGGSRHDYPTETAITVTRNDCGVDVRWDALQERWDNWTTCSNGHAIGLRSFISYHQFFGQVDRRDFTCSAATVFRPESEQPGTKYAGRCSDAASAADIVGTVVSIDTVTVGGQPHRALRCRLEEKLTGETKGTRTSDSWYALDDGLLLQRTAVTDADTKATFGFTHYREELRLHLISTTPLR